MYKNFDANERMTNSEFDKAIKSDAMEKPYSSLFLMLVTR
jgi:hypothetical protein